MARVGRALRRAGLAEIAPGLHNSACGLASVRRPPMLRRLRFGSFVASIALVAATLRAQCPSWIPLGAGAGLADPVSDLARFDAGSGPLVYAAHGVGPLHRFDGTNWSTLAGSPSWIQSLTVGALGANGPTRLFALDLFFTPRVYDGASWSVLPGVTSFWSGIGPIAVLDDGTGSGAALFVGGMLGVNGSSDAHRVARWNGTTWRDLGVANGAITALVAYDDGSGQRVYVGGNFTTIDGVSALRYARWNGTTWSALPGGNVGGLVRCLCVHDDGAGRALFAGGSFLTGIPSNVLRWDGAQWSRVGSGLDGPVDQLAEFDDGTGRALYAVGSFTNAGSVATARIARWDGREWAVLGLGLDAPATELLASTEPASGAPELLVGGGFGAAGGLATQYVASWRGCSFDVFCAGDGADPAVVACPCGNFGGAGRGCANSVNANGAQLAASGLPVVAQDTLTLATNGVTGSFALFFQGDAFEGNGTGALLGDGVRCVGGSLRRLGTRAASGGVATHGFASGSSIASIGLVPATGGVEYYQAWYRNAASYCTSDTFNLTNGVRVLWVP